MPIPEKKKYSWQEQLNTNIKAPYIKNRAGLIIFWKMWPIEKQIGDFDLAVCKRQEGVRL